MSIYKRLQLDNNNLKDEENSNKLILQDKYLKYKYKYLKQKEIIQTRQRCIASLNLEGQICNASLNLEGGAGVIDYITNNPKTAIATAGAVCYGFYCLYDNFRSNLSLKDNIGILLNSSIPTRIIYKYIYDKTINSVATKPSKITFSKLVQINETYAINEYIRQGSWKDDIDIDDFMIMVNNNREKHITDIRFLQNWRETAEQNQQAEKKVSKKYNVKNIFKTTEPIDDTLLSELVKYEHSNDKYNFLLSIMHITQNELNTPNNSFKNNLKNYIEQNHKEVKYENCQFEYITIPKWWESERKENNNIKKNNPDTISVVNIYIPIEKNKLARRISTNTTEIDIDIKTGPVSVSSIPVSIKPVSAKPVSTASKSPSKQKKIDNKTIDK